jgi:hypothetical protein
MKKLLSLACFIVLSLSSCSSDTDSTSSAVNDVLVKKMVQSNEETPDYTEYYNYIGKKISNINNRKYFTYTGNLITRIETYNTSTSALELDETLTYDASGRLSAYERAVEGEDIISRITFAYTPTTIITNRFDISPTHTYFEERDVYHLSGGEIQSVVRNMYTDGVADYSYTQAYSYDSKNNPFRNIIGYDKLDLLLNWYFLNGRTRNILSVQFNYPDFTSGYTWANSYDSLNFPITSTRLQDGVHPVTTQYYYE